MANSKPICSIPDCDKPVKGLGFCNAHYLRLKRHGDPFKGATSPGSLNRFFHDVVLPYEGDECLAWPFSRASNGYAYGTIDGRYGLISRHLCEAVHGNPPTETHEAAHSCGNGHLGCVTKKHLFWKTPVENAAERIAHGRQVRGEAHGVAKLTEADILEIRKLCNAGDMKQREIAALFGISQQGVSVILHRKRWGWLDPRQGGPRG